MEKYSQFRDRSTGIAPFFPVSTPLTFVSTITHFIIFLFRLPFFLTYVVVFFFLLNFLPLPMIVRKVAIWALMGIPGIWWVDIQLDGVKRGTLANQPGDRFPHPGSIIVANFTSPIDAVYLAAIFDPLFTVSYPETRKLQKVGLLGAVMKALSPVRTGPPPNTELVGVEELLAQYPDRVIAVFPECGTTNGKAILPLSPSVLRAPTDVHIFPVSIRYAPSDVTTPLPGRWIKFLWKLLSQPTTYIRVRVAEEVLNTSTAPTNGFSSTVDADAHTTTHRGDRDPVNQEEQKVLNKIGEALARLGRVKRVGLTMNDKAAFMTALKSKKRRP